MKRAGPGTSEHPWQVERSRDEIAGRCSSRFERGYRRAARLPVQAGIPPGSAASGSGGDTAGQRGFRFRRGYRR